ncbi:hypothetical protein BC629DRAFT_1586351 [Irpex lacteus]|nr:hypothetical protein BC629DRAFT_1586351 [Irpex lacteus]
MRSLIILTILAAASFAISKPVRAPSLTLTRRLQNSNTQAVPDTGFSLLPAVTVFSTWSFPDVFGPSITLSLPLSLIRSSKSIVSTPSQTMISMLPTPGLVPVSSIPFSNSIASTPSQVPITSINSSNSISPTDAGADLTSGSFTASQSTSSLPDRQHSRTTPHKTTSTSLPAL